MWMQSLIFQSSPSIPATPIFENVLVVRHSFVAIELDSSRCIVHYDDFLEGRNQLGLEG